MTHDDKSREQFEQTLLIMWPNIALGRQQRKPDLYAHDEVQAAWENYRRAALSPASSTGPIGHASQYELNKLKLPGALYVATPIHARPNKAHGTVPIYVAPAQQAEAEKWISVTERLPEIRERPYQVVSIAKKQYGEGNYEGQGIKSVVQDWAVRNWPQNFTHWMELPPLSPAGSNNGAAA